MRGTLEQLVGTATRPLIVAPTSGGKRVIAAEIINRRIARGGRVLVIAHRRGDYATNSRDTSSPPDRFPPIVSTGEGAQCCFYP